jgi:hypothetical protein
MLYDVVESPEAATPAELRDAYEAELRTALSPVGVDAAADATGVDADRLAALLAGESPELTLSEAAAILALRDDVRDADTVVLELQDDLLLGMTTGIVSVDDVAAAIDADLTGQEVQQAIEGRTEVTLADLAEIHAAIAARNGD